MNEDNTNKPKLRVLPKEQELQRLEITDSSERMSPAKPGDSSKLFGKKIPEKSNTTSVEVLRPDHEAKLNTRSFEPDVAEILQHDEVETNSEEGWGDAIKKSPPLGWFALAGVVICSLAIWAVVSVFKAQPDLIEVEEGKRDLIIDKIKEVKEVRHTLNSMKSCVRGYLTAKTVDDKLAYVRHPERVRPLMEEYYQRNELIEEDFRQFERLRSMGLESQSFIFSQVELLNGKTHMLLLEQLEDGTFRVDWESDVCYLPIFWDKYVDGSSAGAVVMRVYVKRDNFYAHEFRDESIYDCYHLTSRDSDNHVFGFVKKGSDVAMDIDRFLKRTEEQGGQSAEPIMLLLRFPEATRSKKCVWIDQMIAPRWTYVKSPDSETKSEE